MLKDLKEKTLNKILNFVEHLDDKKASVFCYWLQDYVKFLNFENQFKPTSLKRYKRGDIIKAHLGFNIGSEEGGLHYCVVLEKNNPLKSPIVTVAPLTSYKPSKDINNLHYSELYIGDEIFNALYSRLNNRLFDVEKEIKEAQKIQLSEEKKQVLLKELSICKSQNDELLKMKKGSIVLLGQIKTISKIRIYNPKHNGDILSGVRLSNDTLDLIDNKLIELFIKV